MVKPDDPLKLLSLSPSQMNATVTAGIFEVLGKHPDPSESLAHMGGTSLDATELTMVLEGRLAIDLPIDFVHVESTVWTLTERLLRLTADGQPS